MNHVDVYHKPGRYGGWPANHGIWSWGDEILVGFSAGHMADPGSRPGFHMIDPKKPEEHLLARSIDGGEMWKTEDPSRSGSWIGAMEGRGNFPHEPEPVKPFPIDFMNPDFCMTCRMTAPSTTKTSRIYYSYDRGRSWAGPVELPLFDAAGIAARTDYRTYPWGGCSLFLTAMKDNGREGRPFMAETSNGGLNWKFVSWMSEDHGGYSIMPSTVILRNGELVSAIRKRGMRSESHGLCWIEIHRSLDAGMTWCPGGHIPVSDTGRSGNPGDLLKLEDGRLVLCYGYRRPPYNICAMISEDGGKTWLERIILRRGGGCHDIGYTRSVQRPDGKIVTVYYWCDLEDSERYIAATIWEV